jgi:hypothetical protein
VLVDGGRPAGVRADAAARLGTSFLVHPGRDLVVVVPTQRLFDGPQVPAVHTDLQAAALAACR